MEEKLMKYLTKFELTDFVGFATLVKIDREKIRDFCVADDCGDFIVDLVEKFSFLSRSQKKKLLKLAKDVAADNAAKGRVFKRPNIEKGIAESIRNNREKLSSHDDGLIIRDDDNGGE